MPQIKLTKKELKEIVDLYIGIRQFLDIDGEQECLDFIKHRLYKNNDNANGYKEIHENMSRFVPSIILEGIMPQENSSSLFIKREDDYDKYLDLDVFV